MKIQILKQAGRIGGRIAWTCLMPDGTTMDLTIREVMCFARGAH